MADVFDQVASQPTQQSATGDVFDQATAPQTTPAEQSQPQDQPGFLQRAYETSPLPGIVDAVRGTYHDLADTPQKQADALHGVVDSIAGGDWRGAANHAMSLLFGSENPFQDAAKSVIQSYVKQAAAKPAEVAAEIPGASGLAKYVNDVKAGNTRGAIGDVVGTATSILPMVAGDEASTTKAGDIVSKAGDVLAPEKLRNAVADTVAKAKPLVSEEAAGQTAQPEAQQAVRAAAQDAGAAQTPSIRSAFENAGDQVMAKSKAAYRVLDDATGGRFQRFSDQIRNLQMKMNEVAGIDDDAYEKYELKRNEIETVQANVIDDLVQSGKIDSGLADEAKANFKKASALYDLDSAVKSSTSGVRPEMAVEGSTPETLDANKLISRLNKLNDSGRLAQAIGPDGAAQIIRDVDKAARSKAGAVSTAKLVKTVAKYGAAAVGLGALGHGAASILGGK
jgi:hypothetical protein